MKSVFITGASGGIGGAAVERFARQGWRVFAGVRRTGDVEAGPAVTPVLVDVTDEDAVREAAERIDKETGDDGLRAVVNNAGLIVSGPLELVPGSSTSARRAPASPSRSWGRSAPARPRWSR